jgi:hypothetical protein
MPMSSQMSATSRSGLTDQRISSTQHPQAEGPRNIRRSTNQGYGGNPSATGFLSNPSANTGKPS